jgi:replicative DNA helicase
MKTYVAERLLIGLSLRYGKQVVQIASDVTPDKFIYGLDNVFSKEHSLIWNSIINNVFVQRCEPNVANTEGNKEYLNQLVSDLVDVHCIYDFDPNLISWLSETILTRGTVYQMSRIGGNLMNVTTSVDVFEHFVSDVNLEDWLNNFQKDFRDAYALESTGYKHVSTIADTLTQKWDRMYAGEQMVILPSGWPTISKALLYPVGQLALIHGMSGIGKSAYVMGTLLGTALGLKVNGIKGCVAVNSLEMPAERLISRLASLLAGVDVTRMLGAGSPLTREEFERLKEWALFVGTLPIYIDDNNLITTGAMGFQASALHSGEHGPVWQLATDYTELFMDEGESKEQEVSHVVRNQFAIAHELNCSVLAISQSTYEGTNQSKFKIAGMTGLRYSRGATQAADIIVELWNPIQMRANGLDFKIPEDGGLDDLSAWLLIQKYRDGGRTGAVRIGWENTFTRFYDYDYVFEKGGQMITYNYLNEIAEAKKLTEKYHIQVPEVSGVWGSEWA